MSKPLNKPFRTPDGPKKFSVYVKGENGPKKVNFGDPDAEIKRDDPARKKAFRDRHNCDNPGPKDKPRYWSCKMWSTKPVSKITKEALPLPKGQPGVQSPFWFWAAEKNPFSKKVKQAAPALPDGSTDEQVNQILIDTPGISGATMVNTLKAKGLEIVDKKKTLEADGLSTNVAVSRAGSFDGWRTRAGKRGKAKAKESAAHLTGSANALTGKISDGFLLARFMEGNTPNPGVGPYKFRVALIQEGLGNLRDGFYYTKDALASAVAAFEGRKCYADHPSRSEEQDRPERSVRDIVGHFQNVQLEEGDDGVGMLTADLIMLPDPPFEWARSLVRQAIEYSKSYPDKEFIGLSINANGDADSIPMETFLKENQIPDGAKPKLLKAKDQGLNQVRVVRKITDAVSTDLVTEPGARGRVLELIEGETMKKEEMKQDEGKKDILPEAENDQQDHEDIAQDKALILDMIKKHMGEASEGMEGEAEGAAHEAYQAYKEMGYSEDEAMKCAAHAMKLAKHMAGKQSEAEKCEGEAEEKKESEEKKEEEAKHSEADLVKLTARIAFLERELKSKSLTETLDKKLKESGLGRSETDKIRSLIGKPRSEAHIDEVIKVFKEAFGARSESKKLENLFVVTEKTSAVKESKAGFSFADCLRK